MIDAGAMRDLYGQITDLKRALERRRVEVPLSPVPAARLVASGTVIGNSSVTPLSMTSATFDTDTMYDATNHRLKFTRAGIYRISGSAYYPASTAGNIRWTQLIHTSGTTITQQTDCDPTGTFGVLPIYHSISTNYRVAAGDYVNVSIYQDTGASMTVTGDIAAEYIGV